MSDNRVSFTSLCYITKDHEGRIWLSRLADVEDGILHTPFKSERTDNYFENRDELYRRDGPTAIGTIGVWEWTAIPNRNNPATDYVESYYVKDYAPVRVVVLGAKSLNEVVEQLQNGTAHTQDYLCDTFFCYEPRWEQLIGVLCRSSEFKISDQYAKLSETIYSLPSYTISSEDIYNWEDCNLRFLKTLQVGEPSGYVLVGNTDKAIRTLILERFTWPLFKSIGATKADWRNSKIVLEKICGESLYESVVQKLKCTPDQAKQAVDDFVDRANTLLETGDIDADILAQIAIHHDGLRELCEKAVSEKWHDSHAAEIAKAEAEVSEMEDTISIAKKQYSELLGEITTKQGERDRLLAEIDQYESIGKETQVAVRQKIADAQKDIAGFIADISVVLPQSNATLPSGNHTALWQYNSATDGRYSDEDIELAESWHNEYNAIHQNLSHALSIESDFCSMLTAFLYAIHINNVPILIAGPGGQDIAEVLSVSMYANGAGQLTLGNECDLSMAERISESADSIVSVQNMFGKGWTDALPQKFTRLKKQIIWTHPYVEDLLIEPKGLYNYMFPMLSECFIGYLPTLEMTPGARAEKFQPYISKGKRSFRTSAFKRLGLSKLLLGQLTRVLSDAKFILDDPNKEKDLELLFGVLPLCVLTGRLDILEDVIESENGISNSVKAEAARYIEKE